MKKILFSIDFSDDDEEGLKYALSFAYNMNAHLVVLHADDQLNLSDTSHLEDRLLSFVSSNMDDFYQNVPIEYLVKRSKLEIAISETMQKEKINLLILPITNNNLKTTDFIPKKILSIIQKTTCPVLLIPPAATFDSIRNIVLTTDYTSSDYALFHHTLEWSVKFNAIIHCLHIMEDETNNVAVWNNMNNLEGIFRKSKINFDAVRGGLAYEIADYAEKKKADLIVMTNKTDGFFDRLLRNEETKKIGKGLDLPFLIFKK